MISQIIELLVSRWDFFSNLIIEHLIISLLAILFATIIGLLLGVFISEHQKSSPFILSIVNFIYTIPAISLLGILIPLSGIGNATAIIALTIYALLPIVRNTHTGITNIDASIIEAAKGMGSTKGQLLLKIKLPLAFPVILAGFRNMVVMTIALTGIASFIGAGGLGVAIYRGITTNNSIMTIVGSLLIAIIAFLMDFIFMQIEKIANRKNKQKKKNYIALAFSTLIIISLIIINPSSNKETTLNIATKPMSEQYIIGEMYKFLIEEDLDINVKLTQGVGGGTANIQPAMESKEIDLYPEYTGTGWNAVLKEESVYTEKDYTTLKNKYLEKYDFIWLNKFGFNNTYGLAITKDLADKYDIETYSDLAYHSSTLVFGAEYDFFDRQDGYQALKDTYDFAFKKTMDLDIGLKYQAIKQKKVDVISIFTTDGQLSSSELVVLKDDLALYPSYMCTSVIRAEVLEEYPKLEKTLMKLDNVLDDKAMAKLNYLVEEEKQEPKEVAFNYLVELGLVKGGQK
ncbi:ABC transporter permease subunit [Erysipelotrichaceae bacterium OttesenSCG-928-M19]|nr:ABC transporter permease subunit [Erysipelotrichaceae bacterium OttesenSCG-928-M19]